MIKFRDDIFPNSLSFKTNVHDILQFENGGFEIRGKIQKDYLVSLSFKLNNDEYYYFKDFFENINNGMDNFLADFRGSEEEYSIASDIDFRKSDSEIDFYDVSFQAFLVFDICNKETVNLISEVEKNINLLKNKRNYYVDNIDCSNITQYLIFEVDKNIRLLKGGYN